MNEAPTSLHILTPYSQHEPTRLGERARVEDGALIADFRSFPPSVWQLQRDGTLQEITPRLTQSRDYWTPVREWLVDFTRQTGLQDILQIEGYGVWWTLNAQKFVPGLTEVGNAFVWIDMLRAVADQLRPSTIFVHGRHQAITHLVEQIFPASATEVVEAKSQRHQVPDRPPRKPLLLLTRLALGVLYVIYSLLRPPGICLLSNTNLLRRVAEGSAQELQDVYLGSVANSLRQRGWRVAVVEKYGWNASWAGLRARGFFFPSDLIYALTSSLMSRIRRPLRRGRVWHAAWSETRPTVKSHLQYGGCDLTGLVLPMIARQFKRRMPLLGDQARLWRRILSLWDPKALYVNNAYGAAALPPIIAAKALNIPTVEQQHGVIGRNHFAYLVPTDLDTAAEWPLCDGMAVWGEYTKSFLVQHEVYEPEKLTVTGFPRIDQLLDVLPARADTLKNLGVPPDASVVLYTPNRFAEAFRTAILDSVQRAGDVPLTHWIIKPHPAMNTSQTWQEAIDHRSLQNVTVVSGSTNFYALLAACDIHVTFASTALIEAAVLGKPNVGLCTASTVDPAGYLEAGAYLPAQPSDVGCVVSELLSDEAWQQQLLATQLSFAAEWCLHDGKAIDRISELIESVGKSSSQGRNQHAF